MITRKKQVDHIVNLTKHEIVIGDIIVPTSCRCIRRREIRELIEIIEYDGREIEVYSHQYGDVNSIPERKEGTIYLVSYPVAMILQRDDVYSLGEIVRDENGKILGAMCLSKFENEVDKNE